jgi:O-antigen/teichoic acid export membrane protein
VFLRSIGTKYFGGSWLKRRLLRGSSLAFGERLGGAVIGLVTNGLLARMLSPPEFEAYFLVLIIISLGALVGSLGLPKTVVRFVAENLALDQFGRTRRVIYTVLGIGVLGTLGVRLAYLLVVGDLVVRYLFDSPALVAVTGLTAGWLGISGVQKIRGRTSPVFQRLAEFSEEHARAAREIAGPLLVELGYEANPEW